MNRICSWLLLGAGVCCAQMTRSYSDPKAEPVHRVCTLPTEARLMRVGMKGGESLTQDAEEWAAKFDTALKHSIEAAGGELSGDLSTEAQKSDEATRQSVVTLRQKYSNVSIQIRKKRGDVRKGRFTLGDIVSLLPCARDVDSIAFVDASGTIQTGSRRAISILAGGMTGAFLTMARYEIWIAFADARNGEIKALVHVDARGGRTGVDPELALKKNLVSHFKKLGLGPSTAHK